MFRPKTHGSRGIILYEKCILLVKNINVNHWSLPGGKIDTGESPEQCLVRELNEELSLGKVRIDYKLGEYLSEKEGKKDTVHIFIVKLSSFDFQKQWELEDARWFDLDNLPDDISPAGLRRVMEFQADKKDVFSEW